VFGLWLRRFVAPFVAWSAALVVAVSPNLVILAPQLRGYTMAMFFMVLALYLLDLAFERKSAVLMIGHIVSLMLAALSAFPVAFVILGIGMYALWRFVEWKDVRPLLPVWALGQVACAGLYVWLYFWIVKPMAAETALNASMRANYLKGGFLVEGQSVWMFLAKAIPKQLVYVMSSVPAGWVATLLMLLGIVYLLRKEPARLALLVGSFLIVLAALAGVHPMSATRHTSVIGLIGLVAVAAGHQFLHTLMPRASWLVPVTLIGLSFVTYRHDPQNVSMEIWDKPRWQRALDGFHRAVKPNDVVLADFEAGLMVTKDDELRAAVAKVPRMESLSERNGLVVYSLLWDWNRYLDHVDVLRDRIHTLRERYPDRRIWVLDAGFDVWVLRKLKQELGVQPVFEEHNVLFLAAVPGTGDSINGSDAHLTKTNYQR
jgi:hypothetical protein